MNTKFCCSSVTMFRYLNSYLDNATKDEYLNFTVQEGRFRIDEFKRYDSVSTAPDRAEVRGQVSVDSLIRLKNLCRVISDQPITISVTTNTSLDIYCIV